MRARAPAEALRDAIVAWFRREARQMPWRSDPTPYHVLMSELMLQQTRVDTVVPYFERFIARWPTLQDLAAADESEVLEAWAGLGYYRRARNLLAAARQAAEAGGLPADPEALRALPGIGPYTAGAIASIAFGVPAVAVDGNVERVISRVDGRHDDPRSASGRRALEARVAEITAPGVASEVTQGLMELGATCCTPRSPRCGACPWEAMCVGRRQGEVESLPRLPARKKPMAVTGVAALVSRGDRVLLGRRPPGLLGGLWEPVLDEVAEGEATAVGVREMLARRTGLSGRVRGELGAVRHVFTHRSLSLTVYDVAVSPDEQLAGDGSYEALAWVPAARPDVALSKLATKVLALRDEVTLPWLAADPE